MIRHYQISPVVRITSYLMALITAAATISTAFAQSYATIQNAFERDIREFLSGQLKADEFLVYALVTTAAEDTNSQVKSKLPYSSLSIDADKMQAILKNTSSVDLPAGTSVRVSLVFDESITQEKQVLLTDIVTARFRFNSDTRTLDVRRSRLKNPPPPEAQPTQTDTSASVDQVLALEKARMESEMSRARLETERAKLDLKRQELALVENRPQPQNTPAVTAPPTPTPTPTPTATAPENTINILEMLKDFQLSAVFLVLAVIFMLAIMIGGRFYIKGMSPLSSALSTIGTSIASAVKSQTATPPTAQALNTPTSGDDKIGNVTQAKTAGGDDDRSLQEFIDQVKSKLKVLISENRFNFYRVITDMADRKETLPYAASVLVSLDAELTPIIVKSMSVDQIDNIQKYLSAPGGLLRAREIRNEALSMFYGQIAMDEFSGSPLATIRGVTWLTKMTNKELAGFTLGLPQAQRPIFLSCLTPERIRMMLDQLSDKDREQLIEAAVAVRSVQADDIQPFLKDLSDRMNATGDRSKIVRSAVDGAKFIADLAGSLQREEQEKVLNLVDNDAVFAKKIRSFYIPFSAIVKLPKDLILEIFGNMQDIQIAKTIFDSSEEVRSKIISTLPNIKGLNVTDELKRLDSDAIYAARNKQASSQLQREVSQFLLRLNSEGLLNTDETSNLKIVEGAA